VVKKLGIWLLIDFGLGPLNIRLRIIGFLVLKIELGISLKIRSYLGEVERR
jgi:hypothetical protein